MMRSWLACFVVWLCAGSLTQAQVTPDPMGAPVPYEPAQPYGLYAPGAPPPPAYAPSAFVPQSEAIRARMDEVRHERVRLIREGRPENWELRRVGGIVGMAVGGATLGTVLALALMPGLGPHSGERVYSKAESILFPIAATLGAASFGVGLWAFKNADDANPNRSRIDALHDEYEHLARDYKLERRRERLEQRERRQYSVLPAVSREQANATRFMLVLSTTL